MYKSKVKDCWTCQHGKVTSKANTLAEFLDTATISCKEGCRCDPELCGKYKEKKGNTYHGNC